MSKFETKDSGRRQRFESGMQRDTEKGKPRFDLLIPNDVPYEEQILTRFAELMARGAEKYQDRNWEKAEGDAEIDRAKSSAFRHFMQWFCGEHDEDHAVAVMFNLMVVETIRSRRIKDLIETEVRTAEDAEKWDEKAVHVRMKRESWEFQPPPFGIYDPDLTSSLNDAPQRELREGYYEEEASDYLDRYMNK